jgi:hypothetical protein
MAGIAFYSCGGHWICLADLLPVTGRTFSLNFDPKPPKLQKGGFLLKILEVVFRKINLTIDNHKAML